MDILIVGLSSLARRKVIPALLDLDLVDRIHVASRNPVVEEHIPKEKRGEYFTNYDTALNRLDPCVAYISLPNSLHAEWTRRALELSFHVAIDKPSFMSLDDAKILCELSRSKGVTLAEVNVWNYHPMAQELRKLVLKEPPLFVQLIFSSPPLAPENFRYDPALGGGVILDRASYAVSSGRVLLGRPPDEVSIHVSSRNGEGLDLSASLQMNYGATVLQATFSLEGEYVNEITLLGRNYIARANRIFTPPPEAGGEIQIRRRNVVEERNTGSCNTFREFFRNLLEKIAMGNSADFEKTLLSDARVFQLFIDAQGTGHGH